MKVSRLLSATALVSSGLLLPNCAFAQDAKPVAQPGTVVTSPGDDEDDQSKSEHSKDIVVTGSRIRSPNVTSDIPMTSIGGDTLTKSGNTSIGDELNNLPQLASTFSQQNPGAGIGIAGLSLLDLRGLGTQRTLVLVNGRRHVAADILNNAVSPDVSSIPSNLIERVDIVTGGNSAVYGSDAIAGVVNFILKRDFNGIELRGNAGVTEAGFSGNQSVSFLAGKNFAGGKGNVTVAGEYTNQARVYASDVPWFQQNNNLATVDADSGVSSDGFPDAVFVRDIRSTTISPYGLVAVQQKAGTSACGVGTLPNNGPANTNGTPFSCTYIFTDTGRLTQLTGTRFGTGPNGTIIGGNGPTNREGKTVSILPSLERYNINLLGHYEFAPALELFVEAKWDRVNAVGNNSGPSFIQTGAGNSGNVGDARERPRLDNPYLNPTDRVTLANAILTAGCNTALTGTCPAAGNLSAADQAAIAAGTYRFQLARNLIDVGLRDEKFQRDTFRVVGGFKGTFNGDWSYELSGNYGRFDQRSVTQGYIDRQRFSLAMDAGLDPATNTIKCRSQYDAASAFAIQRPGSGDATVNANRLAADIAACRPYNPFGSGTGNAAAIAYFSVPFKVKASLEQLDFQGFVSGDLSQLFELPGGPIRFAVGAEYRREKAYYKQDQFTTDGYSNAVSIPVFAPPAFEVKEAYGELQIPILKDLPFFKELTVTGAARVSEYQGGTGTVWTYNGGVQWSPVSDIRFRANYARAVRAPNVSETGFPLVPNFSNGFIDPCSANAIGNSTLRTTNCTNAVGAANLAAGNITNGGYSLPIVSGSNTNLQAEKSDSYTFGAVLQPRWIPGLSLTIDYYNIKVKGVISTIAVQTLVNNCYDFPQPNIFCAQFQRYAGPGIGPNGEKPGAILGNSLINAPLNFASRVRKGIDVDVSYRTRISDNVGFNTSLIYVHSLKVSDYQDPTNPNFENRILGEIGYPADEFRLDADLSVGQFTLGYRLHYIGRMYTGAWENYNSLNGLPPQNADATEPQKYPTITYSDFRLEWNLPSGSRKDAFQFYSGVDNAFNQVPPLGSTATGVGTAIYDFRGRTFYAGFRVRY